MSGTITTSIITGGTNSHASTAFEFNAMATDFVTQGCNGTLTSTSGVAPATGSFAVNAQVSPAMFVDVTLGSAYIAATPAGQAAQNVRAYMTANWTSYAISANASGSTKFDWIYLKVDPTNASTPDVGADNVTALFTSRSTSNSADNGSPPTYGILLAVVTVANGASSISNSSIADARTSSTLSSPAGIVTSRAENSFDHVASGCVWSGDSYASTLNGSMTAGVAYIGGVRVAVPVQTAHVFTASKDTYVYVDNTGNVTYNPQTNNASSPALPSNAILLGIIISGAGNIADVAHINQGQETKVLPIASSIPYQVTDSNGVLICPRDPNRKVLSYRQIIANLTGVTSTSAALVPGLTTPVIIPTGRKVKITAFSYDLSINTATAGAVLTIWDGTVGSGTQVARDDVTVNSNGVGWGAIASVVLTPSATTKTYNVGFHVTTNTGTLSASSVAPAFLLVELV